MWLFHSLVLTGITWQPIRIEIDIQNGIPSCTIVGLWDTSVQESRERIRSALKNSGFEFPSRRITINLAPAHIRKTGSHLDLGMALGLIIQSSKINLEKTIFLGELALDGKLRKMVGALPLVISAQRLGYTTVILPLENMREVSAIQGIRIYGLETLSQVVQGIESAIFPEMKYAEVCTEETPPRVLLESIIGQTTAKRALILAAAGQHNMILEWPPGSGKSMLAAAIQGILPDLTPAEQLEVAQIYSVVGLLERWIPIVRPFRQIHRSASPTSILGWGRNCHPWEMSLAHTGVLFFDELLEFDRGIIESLREPMESRTIHISRVYGNYTYPASFMFIGAMNPCPCGYLWDHERSCTDSSTEISKYRWRLSGPILDRIDMNIHVPRVSLIDIQNLPPSEYSTAEAKALVVAAYSLAIERQWKPNSLLSPQEVGELEIEPSATEILMNATERLALSLRGYHRILRVSRTIADLECTKIIASAHIAEAIGYRRR